MKVSGRNAIIIFILVAILAVNATFYTADPIKEPKYYDISVLDAKKLIEDNHKLLIIDVRTTQEFEEGHIENAINIPINELEDRVNELNKEDELLVYCRTGNRSRTALKILYDAGYTKVYHMSEGISVWVQQGFPIAQ